MDFGTRMECVAWNFEDKLGAGIELRDDRKIAIIACARRRGEAPGNLGLDDEMHFVDEVRELEEVVKDGRGDVVGEISVDAHAPACCDRGEIRFENIARHDGEIGKVFREAAQASDQGRIQFDGVDGTAGPEEIPRDFAMAGADLDPAMLLVAGERRGGMRRDADGAGDLFAPVEVGEKMLAKALASHGWECSSRSESV